MKIGIYDPYLDTLGGGERYMLTIASCLSSKNKVSVFWDEKGVLERAEKRFDIDLNNVVLKQNIFSAKISSIKRIIKSREYDLIIFLSDGSIPVVASRLILHFQFPVGWVNPSIFNKIKFSRIDKVICNSKFTKEFIDKKFGINSEVIFPPIGSVSEKSEKENIILTVGRLGELESGKTFKKHEFLIEVFKKMIDGGFAGFRFVIAISYKEKDKHLLEKMKELIGKYPIEVMENVEFKRIEKLYAKSKIYWHAAGFEEDLVTHPERAEHFGITTVEAMSAGAVPVVFGGGGQLEIVEDGKNGFIWQTEEDLINRSKKVLGDNSLWQKLSKDAIETSKKFRGERFCKDINEIIKK